MAQKITTYTYTDSIAIHKYKYPLNIEADSVEISNVSIEILNDLYTKGFLEATYKIEHKDSIFNVHWVIGNAYEWVSLKPGNVPEYLLSKSGYREKLYSNTYFDLEELTGLFKKIITESENNGRPFAHLSLSNLSIINGKVEASLTYKSGPEIIFDNLVISGTYKIKPKWLEAYLGIREGSLFSQKALDNIESSINNLPFVYLNEPPSVTFQNSTAKVFIDVMEKPANSVDGIIGFLPNEEIENELLITGQLFLGLSNLFNSGKSLQMEWQSLKPRTQLLEIDYDHPNVIRTPFDFNSRFYLLKEDTFFINRELDLSIALRQEKSRFSFFFRAKNSSILTATTLESELTDLSINYYGLGYTHSTLPKYIVPQTGVRIMSEVSLGNKNAEDPLTGSISKSIQYNLIGSINAQLKLTKYFVIAEQLLMGKLINDQLYQNDLYRIGGLKSIRGFNENFFFAEQYFISRLELRLHFQKNSYTYTFYDQGYYYNDVQNLSYQDYPLGIGVGLAMELNFGILNIAYGLGKSKDQIFDTRLSKIHFGYIARF